MRHERASRVGLHGERSSRAPYLVVLACLTTLVLAARDASALNPICTGSCPQGGNAPCASSADCGVGACLFPDSCLPGGAFAISRVIEDSALGANAYPLYLGAVPLTVSETEILWHDSVGVAAMQGPYDTDRENPQANPLPITPGRTYYFAAKLKAPPRGAANFMLILDNLDPESSKPSPYVFGPADWTQVGIMFRPTTANTYYLQVFGSDPDGSGEFGFKDAVLYELQDYGVYARFKLVSPAVSGTLRDTFTLRHNFNFYPTGEFMHVDLPAGAFSDWLPVHEFFPEELMSLRDLFGMEVRESDGTTPLNDVTLQIQVATSPDPASVYFDKTRTSASGRVGLILPDQVPPPTELVENTILLADLVGADRARLAATNAGLPVQPQSFWNGTDAAGGLESFDDISAMDDVFPLFRELGLNVQPQLFDAESQASAVASGLTKGWLHSENIVYPYNATENDYDLAAISAVATDYANDNPYVAALGPKVTDPKDAIVVMDDEAGGMPFAGPLYRQAFHDYLASHGVSLGDVDPYSYGDPAPDPIADPEAAVLYYWQLRFWNEATGQAYRRARLAIEQAPSSGRPYAITFNIGVPLDQYFQYDFGTEFQTIANADGISMMFVEGFLGYNDWCLGQDMGALADYYAAHAAPKALPMGAYLHPWKGLTEHKVLTLAARGFRYFNYYTYGPFDMTTGDGRGGLADDTWELEHIAKAGDALGRSEAAIFGATRPPSDIALLAAQSDPIWEEGAALSTDELGWHQLLQHAGRTPDFLIEELLPSRLTADRRVLVLTRRHLSDAAFTAVRNWVEAGGTLIVAGALPTRNEYGAEDAARATWLGMTLSAQPPTEETGQTVHFAVPARDVTQYGAVSFVAGGDEILATYPGGAPAVMARSRGLGRVVAIGFEAGNNFARPAVTCDGSRAGGNGFYPSGFDAGLRGAVVDLLGSLPARQVEVDSPAVEAHRMQRGNGGALVLLDYSTHPLATVGVRISDLVPGCTVQRTIGGGTLTSDESGSLQVPIKEYEVLSWDSSCALGPDADRDSIPDSADDCVSVANVSQADADGDGIGDACDPLTGTKSVTIDMALLPSAQGWSYQASGPHEGETESAIWSVSDGRLTMDTTGSSLSGSGGNEYVMTGVVNATDPIVLEWRSRVIASEGEPFAWGVAVTTGVQQFSVGFTTGSIRLDSAEPMAFDATAFHDYEVRFTPGATSYELFVDGVLFAVGTPDPLALNRLTFGDLTGSGNARVEIERYRFTQSSRAEPVSSSGAPVPGGSGGVFTAFPKSPALGAGIMAFIGRGSSGELGIYTGESTAPDDPLREVAGLNTAIPEGIGTFTGFTELVASGTRLFFIGTGEGQAGIYTVDAASPEDPIRRLADLTTSIPDGTGTFTGFTELAAGGSRVSFIGTGQGQAGIYAIASALPEEPALRLVDLSTAIPDGTGSFSAFTHLATGESTVSFIGSGTGQAGIYAVDSVQPGGSTRKLADLSTAIPDGTGSFTGFTEMAADGTRVSFIGTGIGQAGVYSVPVAPLIPPNPIRIADLTSTIPGGTGTFTGFHSLSVTTDHHVFIGLGSDGQEGIYRASVLTRVVAVGEFLEGRQVADLRFGRDGLAADVLAFAATFGDGSQGLFVTSILDCAGDCNGDDEVTSDELAKAVDLALRDDAAECDSADVDQDGRITVRDLVRAVRALLDGC